MSPRNKAQHVLTQEGSHNENKPTTSVGKNPQRTKCRFNLLDTQRFIRIGLCLTLEGALAKPFVLTARAWCLPGDGCTANAGRGAGDEPVSFINRASTSGQSSGNLAFTYATGLDSKKECSLKGVQVAMMSALYICIQL